MTYTVTNCYKFFYMYNLQTLQNPLHYMHPINYSKGTV